MSFNKRDLDTKQRFSIRKLTIGTCSVLLSTLFLGVSNNEVVHADTLPNNIQEQNAQTNKTDDQKAQVIDASQVQDSKAEGSNQAQKGTTDSEKTADKNVVQKSDEIKKDNVENTTVATQNSNQQSTTATSAETSSTVQNSETSKSDSSITQPKSETNSLNQKNNTNSAVQSTTTLNVSNLAVKANGNTIQDNKTATATTTTPTTNGGYDSATWGTLDSSKWTGQNTTFDGTNYYQLTGYTGDQTHIIVPNEADFAAANKSTDGLQVSISNDLIKSWQNAATIAFSKTDDKKIKLASTNLDSTFQRNTTLTNLDANSLDTSSVTSMQRTFENASNISSLTGISDWNVQKVTNMTRIFNQVTKVTDLSPLSNWKTDSLQKLNTAFANNSFTNLQGLENWNVSHVTDMGVIFMSDANLTDISALANWDTSNVTDLNRAFNVNQSLTSLHGLENWNTSKVTNLNATFANEGSLVDASAIANWNTSNVTNMSVLFAGSNAQYVDFSNWDFSKVTSASNVINNTQSVVYLGNNSTLTADKLNTLGIANGGFTQPIILTSGNLYTLLSNKNNNTHNITINNADGSQNTTISSPVVYDTAGVSNMTDAINSYKDMGDQKLEDYVTEHNYVLKRVSTAPVDDITGHNNHLVNYANATYQVVTIPADQKKNLQIQDKTTYKGKTLTAKDLVTNVADFPAGTTFEFADNSEPNWNQVGTYNVKVIATYPVSVNGQQYTALTAPATAKVTVTQQMQFTITYWDDTENKKITQFDITNAGNRAYSRLTFPDGVTPANYQSVSVSGVPAGATVAGDFWISFTDPSCNWTIPNYKWMTEAAPSFYGANVVVHLVHKTKDVTNTDPAAQETRTVTADFVKINENGTPEAAPFDSATLDVYYIRKATKDLVTGKVTYGNWKLNTNKGTNGLQVVSGAWTLPTDSSSKITVTAPDLDGYEKVDSLVNGQLTTNFGTVDNITSKLTTYYVPTSLTQKTINRVINLTPVNVPPAPSVTQTTTQSATITRPVRVNADDSGVVFDGFDGSGWTTGEWGRYTKIPVPDNYTKVIKQIVTNPDGTTTETTLNIPTWRPIPAQTVTSDTLPTVINITYTATGTAFLAGTNESTYTGSPITLDDLNNGDGDNPIYVGIGGPTGNVYYLQAGDVEFSSDNGQTWTTEMPTNAGTYELRWSEQGKQDIIKEFGNNSIKWVNAEGNSTFTSTATYIINPAPATFTLSNQTSGNYTKIYDAQPTTSIDPSKLTITANFSNTKVVLDTTGLTSDSYEWVDAQGNSISNPENVGTYHIKLKDSALSTLQKDNPNFTLTNGGGLATYTITQAQASGVLSGSNSRTYDGQATTTAEVNSNGQIGVTVTFPGATEANKTYILKDDDYEWNSGSAPTNAGSYTITLTPIGISNIEKYILGLAGSGQNNTPNVVFSDNAFTGSANYDINKAQATATIGGSYESTYNGQAINSTTVYGKIKWSAHDTTNNVDFTLNHDISANDYSWYTKSGEDYAKFKGQPVNAGTYYLILNKDYINKLNQENPNYNFDSVNGAFTYVVGKATATLNITGSQSNEYNARPVTIDYKNFPLSITTDNEVSINLPVGVNLGADDIVITNDAGQVISEPTTIGTYTIALTDTGLKKFESQTDNYSWTKAGFGTLSITRNANSSVALSGNENIVYTGSPAVIDPANFKVELGNGLTYQLQAGDLQFVNMADGANTNVGTYDVELSDQGRANIAQVQADNYGYDFSQTGFGTVTITQATPSASFSGTAEKSYDGTPISGYTPVVTITAPGNNLVTLAVGDYEWIKDGQTYTTAPSDAGTYTVQLTAAGIAKVKAVNADNLDWSNVQVTGNGTYTINQANALITLPYTTSQTITWTGNPATIDPANFIPEITTNNPNENTIALPSTLQLTAGDYEFLQNGQVISAPSEIGTYQVRLTQAGWQKVQNAITGNNNYTWNYQGEGNYHIEKATASIALDGSASTIYTGNPAVIPATDGVVNGISVKLSNGQTYVLKPEDLEFVNDQGNPIPAPTDAGSYKVRLTEAALGQIRNLESNHYDYTYHNDVVGFTIEKATAEVGLLGNQDSDYTGKAVTLNNGNFRVLIVTNNGQALNYSLKSGDLMTTVENPTNAGPYDVYLSAQGKQNLESINRNYNWKFADTPALLNIIPAELTIGLVGTTSSVYDGNPVKITSQDQMKDLKLRWGGYDDAPDGVKFTLQPSDLVINYGADAVNAGNYAITLSAAAIERLNKENPNYSITQSTKDLAQYIIYARKGRITLSGIQTTPYGERVAIDPSKFTIALTDTVSGNAILYPTALSAGDLQFKDTQYSDSNLPTQVGHYELVPTQQLLAALKEYYPDYDFGDHDSNQIPIAINGKTSVTSDPNNADVDKQHTKGANYVITPVDAYISLNGSESVRYTGNEQTIDYSKYSVSISGLVNDDKYSYTLQDGDLEFVGTTPNEVGNYQVKLTNQALENIRNLNSVDYNWLLSENANTAPFDVTQMPVTVTVSNKTSVPTIIYGKATTLNPGDYTINVKTANGQMLAYIPVAGDLQFKEGTPTSAGTFDVILSNEGLQNIEKQFGTKNYTYTSTGNGNFIIKKASAEIQIISNGLDSMIYNGEAASLNADNYKLEITTNNGQTINISLAADDLAFSAGSNPVNAGSYGVTLTQQTLNKIKEEYPNYDWSNPVASTYTINKANADVTTAGSYDVVYNGQTPKINVDKITNTIATNNGVDLSASTLSADDYEWVDESGKVIANPVNVGTYYLKLKDYSQSKIAINNNYTWNFNGLASVTINKANATIGFNGNQETPYTGSVIALDPDKFEVKLSNGQTYQLTDKDIQVIGNPINVGTYQVELSQAGIDAIKAADSNYNYSYDGSQGLLVIVPVKGNATISGSQTTQDLELDPHNYSVVLTLNGQQQTITRLTASDFVFSKDGHPAQLTEAGTYDVELSGDAINKIRQENPNYNIDFSSTATFTLENSSQTINYVDADNNVISSTDINGQLKGTKLPFTPEIPVGWVASNPSEVPTEITINNETTVIKIKHGITNVDHNNPVPDGEKTVTGALIDGAHTSDLNQTITRTINVTTPDGTKNTEVQTAKIYRNASYDNVTGAVTYGEWSTGSWKEFSPAEIKGYTASEKVVPPVEVKDGQKDETINITYTANEQSGIISYQDKAGNEISTTPLSGKTGETVTVNPEIPAGWELVPGQEIPKTVTTTAEGIPTVVIKIEHGITNVDHNNSVPDGAKTVTGAVINGAHVNDLNQTITRTINVTNPDGTKNTEVQTAKLYRNASYDNVTGEVTYGEWSTADWGEFTPKKIDGYTPSEAVVPAIEVKNGQKDETVDITYTANEQSGIISYQDKADNEISTTPLSGKTGETVTVNPEIPAGWELVPGQEIPQSVTATAEGIPTVVIKIEHGITNVDHNNPVPDGEKTVTGALIDGAHTSDLNQTITRTINVTTPDGTKNTEVQTAKIYRNASYDNVTGAVTYGEWSTGSWKEFSPAEIKGYTASEKVVPPVEVKDGQKDETINITYTANEQSGIISYQDEAGKEISTTSLSGKTGETVTVNPEIPAGWQLVPGQEIPKTVTATAEGISTVVIKVENSTIIVTPETSEKDIPNGKVPGNPSKNYPEMEKLEVAPTRTIILIKPDGSRETIIQKVIFTRAATFNEVTGEITYSTWKLSNSDDHEAIWEAYEPMNISGYTVMNVNQERVTPDTGNAQIEITYISINQPAVTATQTIHFVDEKGKLVESKVYTGKLGEVISVSLSVPKGYNLNNGQSLPTQITIENGMITINLKSESKHPIPNSENKQKTSVTPNTPNAHIDKNNLSSKDNKVVKSHGEKLINTNHVDHVVINQKATRKGTKASSQTYGEKHFESRHMLPQTGAHSENPIFAALGMLAAGLGLFGLSDRKKKKNK